jgi:hypothetical protein
MVEGTWWIVYFGTDTIINGMDVILSEAPAGCTHPYFPLKVGAVWVYDLLNMMGFGEGTETWEVVDSSSSGEMTIFTVNVTGSAGSGSESYTCQSNGVYNSRNEIVLPPTGEYTPSAQWWLSADSTLLFVGFESVSVPAGTFQAARFTILPMGFSNTYWAEGIGMLQLCTERCKALTYYSIPTP